MKTEDLLTALRAAGFEPLPFTGVASDGRPSIAIKGSDQGALLRSCAIAAARAGIEFELINEAHTEDDGTAVYIYWPDFPWTVA